MSLAVIRVLWGTVVVQVKDPVPFHAHTKIETPHAPRATPGGRLGVKQLVRQYTRMALGAVGAAAAAAEAPPRRRR